MKILSVLTLLIGTVITTSSGQTLLTPDEFEQRISSNKVIQLLDVRTPAEYADGHLANSKNLNYKDADFRQQVNKLDKNKPVNVYCLSGGRSGAAAKMLHESGFAEVYDMKGGYIKWSAAGKKTKGSSESGTMDYFQNKALAKELKVDEVPAFLLYKNGKLSSRKNGLLTEADFRKLLDSSL